MAYELIDSHFSHDVLNLFLSLKFMITIRLVSLEIRKKSKICIKLSGPKIRQNDKH